MKKYLAAAALSLAVAAPSAQASGYVQPQMPETIIIEDTRGNDSLFVPVLALVLLLLLHQG